MQRFTTYNLIYTALRKLGVLNRRDVLKQADLEDGIEAFWTLLDRISNQDLMIPFNQRFVFPVVSTKRIYTVGPGGDFVMPRPIGDPSIDTLEALNGMFNCVTNYCPSLLESLTTLLVNSLDPSVRHFAPSRGIVSGTNVKTMYQKR